MIRQWSRDPFVISTDPARLDIGRIHRYLAEESYWARNIPLDLVRKALANSRCYSIHEGETLVGFGRIITDYATFAYVGDVFVVEERRGLGLSKWLVECMLGDPEVQGLRNWTLYTKDAQSLYARFGFLHPENPATVMTIKKPNPYGAPDMPTW